MNKIILNRLDYLRIKKCINDAKQFKSISASEEETLLSELNSAKIVEPQEIPDNVVTMNSIVRISFLNTNKQVEFQIVYLQSIYGPDVKVLPILCGSYANSIYRGGKPEDNEDVKRFLGTLGEIATREADRLFWVLGIDMAHMGERYGDAYAAVANDGEMLAVGGRDRQRMERVEAGDATGFWNLVQERQDDLKWCGSSPLYTFLKVRPGIRGRVRRYEQWNIDDKSVVSFAGMSFI